MRIIASVLGLLALLAGFSCTKAPELKGKVLHVVLEDNVKGLDPVSMYDIIGGEILFQTYETHYQYDYFSETPRVIPMLADGMPQLSKDGLTYTFKLKKGIRYQDDPCFKETSGKGREVKAADFIYSWKREANVANEAQGFWIFDAKIAGINDFQKKFGAGKSADDVMKDEVEGFKALDDHTIQIKLTKPYPQLTYALATSFAAPVPEEAVKFYGKDFERHPVGTGPFKVQSYDAGFKVVVVKNENFREELFPTADKVAPKYREIAKAYGGKRLPLVDAIEFNIIKEEQPR
jgi:oligopeptide transport system substrate-binding protein